MSPFDIVNRFKKKEQTKSSSHLCKDNALIVMQIAQVTIEGDGDMDYTHK